MSFLASLRPDPHLVSRGLRTWGARESSVALVAAIGVAVLIGVPTVLIPNPWFSRMIAPEWWDRPIWIATSVLAGMLIATYTRPEDASAETAAPADESPTRMGVAGSVLTWFAVGCPVCNKIALLALGTSGAMTWFAPLQPVLAVAALLLTGLALAARLQGRIVCALPRSGADRPTPVDELHGR